MKTHEEYKTFFDRVLRQEVLYTEFINEFGTLPGKRPPPGVGSYANGMVYMHSAYSLSKFYSFLKKKYSKALAAFVQSVQENPPYTVVYEQEVISLTDGTPDAIKLIRLEILKDLNWTTDWKRIRSSEVIASLVNSEVHAPIF